MMKRRSLIGAAVLAGLLAVASFAYWASMAILPPTFRGELLQSLPVAAQQLAHQALATYQGLMLVVGICFVVLAVGFGWQAKPNSKKDA